MTDLNANISECIVKADGVIATKVANVCTGSTEWVYFPPSVIALNMLMIGIFAMVITFSVAAISGVFND